MAWGVLAQWLWPGLLRGPGVLSGLVTLVLFLQMWKASAGHTVALTQDTGAADDWETDPDFVVGLDPPALPLSRGLWSRVGCRPGAHLVLLCRMTSVRRSSDGAPRPCKGQATRSTSSKHLCGQAGAPASPTLSGLAGLVVRGCSQPLRRVPCVEWPSRSAGGWWLWWLSFVLTGVLRRPKAGEASLGSAPGLWSRALLCFWPGRGRPWRGRAAHLVAGWGQGQGPSSWVPPLGFPWLPAAPPAVAEPLERCCRGPASVGALGRPRRSMQAVAEALPGAGAPWHERSWAAHARPPLSSWRGLGSAGLCSSCCGRSQARGEPRQGAASGATPAADCALPGVPLLARLSGSGGQRSWTVRSDLGFGLCWRGA